MENGIGVLGNLVPPTWWKAVLAVLVVLLAVFVGRFGGRFLSWVAALALKDRERRYAAWAQRIWWGVVGVAAFSFLRVGARAVPHLGAAARGLGGGERA